MDQDRRRNARLSPVAAPQTLRQGPDPRADAGAPLRVPRIPERAGRPRGLGLPGVRQAGEVLGGQGQRQGRLPRRGLPPRRERRRLRHAGRARGSGLQGGLSRASSPGATSSSGWSRRWPPAHGDRAQPTAREQNGGSAKKEPKPDARVDREYHNERTDDNDAAASANGPRAVPDRAPDPAVARSLRKRPSR